MAGVQMTLQEAITLTGPATQDRRDAVDLGRMAFLAIQIHRIGPAPTTGTLVFEHAPINEQNRYEAIGGSVNLTETFPKTIVITGHTRFLRWNVTVLTGAGVTLRIDLIGRESS